MSNEFNREERYIVFKVSDLGNSLKGDEIRKLAREYAEHRQQLGKEPLKCVVVESDWPEYEPTWKAIEARVNGAQPAPVVPDHKTIRDLLNESGLCAYDREGDLAFMVAATKFAALAAAPEAKP